MFLLAWTAAYTIVIAAAIIVLLIGLRITAVCFASERTRWFWDVLLAVIGLAIAWMLF
jgi:hypothetical protein